MTLSDLANEFEILYELGSLGLPGIESSEVYKLLEVSQYTLINQRLQGQNAYQTAFPDTQKRIDDLNGLIVSVETAYPYVSSELTIGLANGGTYIIGFPDDYFHLIEGGVRVTYSGNGYIEVAKQIQIKDSVRYTKGVRNSNPYVKQPVYHFVNTKATANYNKQIRLYPNSDTVIGETIVLVDCIYIKKPTDLTTVPTEELRDFNDDVYHEIVKLAVDNAVAIATPQKYQVSSQQVNRSE